MAELFGVTSGSLLSQQQQAGFAFLRDEMTGLRSGTTSASELSWAGVGCTSHHKLDSATLADVPNSDLVVTWIGAKPTAGLDFIAQTVQSGRFERLWELEPRFAACVLDRKHHTLSLISDRFGLIPTYFALVGGCLVFGTKLHSLPRTGLVNWRLDPLSVADLLTFEHLTGNRALFQNVEVVPAASILTFHDGTMKRCSYRPPPREPRKTTVREAADQMFTALFKAVHDQTSEADAVKITLSGGLDSRALLGCAHRTGRRLTTCSFGLPGCRDLIYAQAMAKKLDIPNTSVETDGTFLTKWLRYGAYVTGSTVGCMHFHILALGELLTDGEVVLDGMGGDAFTGAHLKLSMYRARDSQRAVDALFHQRASACRSASELSEILDPDFARDLSYDPKDAIRVHFRDRGGKQLWRECHAFDIAERQRRFVQIGPSLMQPLCQVRTPFYSNGFLDVADDLGPRELFEQRAYLRMQAKHLRDLASCSDTARGIPLTWPHSLRFGKKVYDALSRRSKGLLPGWPRSTSATTNYRAWFATTLRPLLMEHLSDAAGLLTGIVRKGVAERLIREQTSGQSDHSAKFGCLLALAMASNLRKSESIRFP